MPYARSGGYRIHYEVEGAGSPVLLHTGYLAAAGDWYDLGYVEALQDDYLLVLLDPLGQGDSDKPHSTAAYTPDHRIADVVAVLDALRLDRTHFWGYSMGGRIGLDLSVRNPDRLLSLIVGGAQPSHSPPNVAWADLLKRGGVQAFLDSVEAVMTPFPPLVRERMLTTADADALAAATLVERPSLDAHVGAINLATLFYCGENDGPHDGARQAADAMPNAAFVSLAGSITSTHISRANWWYRMRELFWRVSSRRRFESPPAGPVILHGHGGGRAAVGRSRRVGRGGRSVPRPLRPLLLSARGPTRRERLGACVTAEFPRCGIEANDVLSDMPD